MKVIISGYGRMGHIIEGVLLHKGIELVCATEDVCATDPEVARECVCIDFTTPAAFRANYKWIADHFKAAVVGPTGWDDIMGDVVAAFYAADTRKASLRASLFPCWTRKLTFSCPFLPNFFPP